MRSRRLTLDLAPWTVYRALARKERPFLIDAGQPWGNEWVSCMGFRPTMQLRVSAAETARSPLAVLDEALAPLRPAPSAGRASRPVPFGGGLVVALAYEAKRAVERVPQTQDESPAAPHLVCARYDAVVAYDHRRHAWHVATWHLDDAGLAAVAEEVEDAVADAVRTASASAPAASAPPRPLPSTVDARTYAARVARALAYIAAGDVYQVNLSLPFRGPVAVSPLALYERLRAVQPVPFGGYFDLGDTQVLSNSPELFLRRRGDRLVTAPIKGTRPRGPTPGADARMIHELRTDSKERAEHVMIVDLERNDLGRICRPGSVRVTRFAELASYRTVHHLVSTVTGRVPAELGIGALLHATFPGGSITGAPKIRAMEIIDELERTPRGFYTGTLGWIDASGDCDLNVAIRTATVVADTLSYHAGGGIVADSRAERERAECLHKAAAFFQALGLATGAHDDAGREVAW